MRRGRSDRGGGDQAVLWPASIPGVEVLHATFNRHVYARHAHEGMTVALVDSGAASFECAGREHVARAGTAFVIRPQEPHTGRGPHNCIGSHLARAEMTVGLEALFDWLPGLHLAEGHRPLWEDESPSKAPITLPVGW